VRKFEKFLFFYSILAVTVIAVSLGVFEPKPVNLITCLVLVPMIFYFWIRLTSPEAVSAEKWSLRFLLALFILSILGVIGVYIARLPNRGPENSTQIAKLTAEKAELERRLAILSNQPENSPASTSAKSVKGESIADLINPLPTSNPIIQITGKPGVKTISVRESPISASKIIAEMDGLLKYSYLDQQNNWYKIPLSASAAGWVSGSQVKEVQ
jgi:hypothetical protein